MMLMSDFWGFMANKKYMLKWQQHAVEGNYIFGEECFTLEEIINGKHRDTPFREYIPGAVREYTGVTDKFGLEIYEADKIRFTPIGEKQMLELNVKWADAGTWLLVGNAGYSTWRFSPEADGRDCRCEVIKG